MTNWKEQERQRMAIKLSEDGYIDSAGVYRWKSNNRVVPHDILRDCCVVPGIIERSRKARDEETAAFIAEYRANNKGPSAEDLHEMRNAFGAGATVVNVITGRKIKL